MVVACVQCKGCVDLCKDVIGIDGVFCEALHAASLHSATSTDTHPARAFEADHTHTTLTHQLVVQQVSYTWASTQASASMSYTPIHVIYLSKHPGIPIHVIYHLSKHPRHPHPSMSYTWASTQESPSMSGPLPNHLGLQSSEQNTSPPKQVQTTFAA